MTKNTKAAQQPAMKLIGSFKEIDKRTLGVHTNGQGLQAEMPLIACSILAKFAKSNDTRIVTACVLKLHSAMPEMSRKNALLDWFKAHGPVTFSEEKGIVRATYVKDGKIKLGDAMAKPFWKFKANEGGAYEPINLDTYVSQQVKKLEKDMKETGRDHTALIMALKGYTLKPSAASTVECDF